MRRRSVERKEVEQIIRDTVRRELLALIPARSFLANRNRPGNEGDLLSTLDNLSVWQSPEDIGLLTETTEFDGDVTGLWNDLALDEGVLLPAHINNVEEIAEAIRAILPDPPSVVRVTSDNFQNVSRTHVAALTSAQTVAKPNLSRKALKIYNSSTGVMYVAWGEGVTTSDYSFQIPASSFYESPMPIEWGGAISAVWSVANGSGFITEISG
jgi:hypothetical protein